MFFKKGKYYGLGKFAEPLILTGSRRAPLWCGVNFLARCLRVSFAIEEYVMVHCLLRFFLGLISKQSIR